ncbi:MAG: MBG domain-containing protein [Candidatus Sungbacteria bacterium]|nr:MBG domain-containing protein [Candidatus Sungbacteria bacterium]
MNRRTLFIIPNEKQSESLLSLSPSDGISNLFIKTKIITSVGLAVFGGIFLFGAQTAFAAVRTSTATGGNWSTGSTWVGGVAPANNDSAVIATTDGGSVTIGAATTNAGLTVNSGAVLNFTGAFVLTENGNVVDNGSITGATGTIKMNSNGKSIDGSGSIDSIILAQQNFSFLSTANLTINNDIQNNKKTITNNGIVTLNGNLTIIASSAVWVQGTNATFNISGSLLTDTLTATASGNTINYNGTTQTVKAESYVNLTIDGSSGVKSIVTGTSVTGTLSIAPTGTATASIGAGLTITVANLTLGGFGRVNGTWGSTSSTATNQDNTYFAATTGILSVTNDTRATPTLSVTNSPVTYNGVPQSATVTGSVSGTVSNVKYDGSATVPTNAATYAITADFAPTDATIYKSLTAASAGNFIISKATPTLSVTNSPVTYNGSAQAATVTGSVAGTASSIKYNGSATTPTNAATYAITADFTPTDTTNYNSLTAASAGNFVISKATPTLSVTNSPVTYNGSAQAATVTGSVAGTVSSILTGGAATQTNAGTYAVTANFTPTDTTNYNSLAAASAGNFVISKATPTLSVTNSPVTYNGSAQAATVSASVAGTVSSILTGGSATQTNAGTYAVTADFTPTDTTNYNSLTAASAGNFVISVADQTITFNTLSDKVLGDSDFIVSATASSGLTVSFSSQTTAVCTVSTATVHIITTGTCTIRASQAGNSSYNAAPNVDQSFNINNPLPTTSSISPTSKTVGDAEFTLTVNGTNFVFISVVNFNGSSRTTSYVSATQLTATIPASDLTTATSSALITVTNPTPGGGTSNAQTFAVNNPTPTTTSISPTSKTVGDAEFTLTVNGTNFVFTSVVNFNGSSRTTSYVSATQLTATIPASDLTVATSSALITVTNSFGGGTSNAQTFAVETPADVTAPSVTAFTIPATSTTLAVSITTFTATDSVAVTGYLVTESSSTPLVSNSGWTTSAPTPYTFSTQGDKTLYAWAKDAAGNISTSLSATTTITLPDTTAPTVTAFAIPTTSSSLTITITTFTATDDIGVTGYLLTEASSTPLASNSGWTTSAPTTYTFSTQGDKTLYAWAKDAAGNISTSLSASTTITFVEVAPNEMQSLISSGIIVPNGAVASSTYVTFNQDVHVVFGGGTVVTIPANAVLTAATDADWNQLSGTASVSTDDAPANYTSAGAMQWGFSSISLTLNQAATIVISVGSSYNGETLTVFRKEAGATAWTQADTCVISSGVCQFTTTTFSSFMAAVFHAPASSSSPSSQSVRPTAVSPTRVEFSGQAYPKSKLQVFFKSEVNGLYYVIPEAIYNITDDGAFTISYTALLGGDYIFGLQAEDRGGRKTGIRPFTVNLTSQNELVATDLFLAPTISFARNTVRKGDVLKVIGYGAANTTIEFEVDGQLLASTAQAGSDGLYQKLITTADYSLGDHTIRVRQKSKNTTSGFSYKKTFAVSQLFFPVTDLNSDGKIDISDWSIFLSKYNSKDPAVREQLDLNDDGKVDISDFSLFIRSLKKK